MILTIQHTTTYSYAEPVPYGLQQLRLTPKSRIGQSVLTWQTLVTGGKHELDYEDQHMNKVVLVSFEGTPHEIVISCQGSVQTADTSGVLGKHAGFAPLWYFERTTPRTRAGAGIRSLIKGLAAEHDDILARCHALMARVSEAVAYRPGSTHSQTTAEEALGAGQGVCQDHAHVMIAAARALGLPARYVSGYLLLQDTETQEAAHAWAEVHVEPLGWIGFDPANLICPDERYVRVATGLDYAEAAPVSGLRVGGPAGETLRVDVQVQQ